MGSLHLWVLILLPLTGVLSDNSEWGVEYPGPICAVRGSNVIIPCNYSYPKPHNVQTVLWCSMNSNKDNKCVNPPYVYNSSSPDASDVFQYTGDKQSNCTLLISNVQFSHSAVYKFRFITNNDEGKWTGDPGVTIKVGALPVIRQSGNGTLKKGDSVNLTCDVNCSHSSPQFVWFKDSKRLPASGSVLHLPALTVEDSGSYSCALKTDEAVRSETLSINVDGSLKGFNLLWLIWVVFIIILVVLALIILAVICKKRKKAKAKEEAAEGSGRKTQDGESTHEGQTKLQTNQVTQPGEDATYAPVCKKPDKLKKRKKNAAQEENNGETGRKTQVGESVQRSQEALLEPGDVMYASVSIKPNKPKGSPVSTVHLEEDDSVIYSAVAGK
ncbi:sialoadhesin-like [Salminus brasiliensis]|uniref:sialoadhesin-like n=1 Tax=Salminus brasiliensis TaxID=930266 RepID=UPI003B82ECC2